MTRAVTIVAAGLMAALDTAQQVLPAVQAFIPTATLAWVNVGILIALAVLHAVVKAAPPEFAPTQPQPPKEAP